MQALYLKDNELIHTGQKTAIATSKPRNLDGMHALVVKTTPNNGQVSGLVTLDLPQEVSLEEFDKSYNQHLVAPEDRMRWWPGSKTLFIYPVQKYLPLPTQHPVQIPHGINMRMKINLSEELLMGGKPYASATDPNVPDYVPVAHRAQWVAVFNSALAKCQEDNGNDCESSAFAQANSVAGKQKCEAADCLAQPGWWITIAGEKLGYCNEHLPGALELFERHNIIPQDVKRIVPDQFLLMFLSPEDAALVALDIPGAEPPEELHLTIAKIEPGDDTQSERLTPLLSSLQMPPITGKLTGIGEFNGALWQPFDAPELPEWRETLIKALEIAGIQIAKDHGFQPHVTLAYLDNLKAAGESVESVGKPESRTITLNTLSLTEAGEQQDFPLAEITKTKPVDESSAKSMDSIADTIASQSKLTADQIKEHFLKPWLVSAGTGNEASEKLQKIAAYTFGFKVQDVFDKYPIDYKLLDGMGAIYNHTEQTLQKAGYDRERMVEAYHPYYPTDKGGKDWQEGDEVRIWCNALSSWTMDAQEAFKYASMMGTIGSPCFVLKTYIPASSVVSSPATGFGEPGTREIILAGGEYTAKVIKRSE